MKKKIDKKWFFKRTLFFIGYTGFMVLLYKIKDELFWWFGLWYLFFFIFPILGKFNSWLDEKAQPKNPYPVDEEFLRRLYPNGKPKIEENDEEEEENYYSSPRTSYSYSDKEEEEYWAREEEYVRYEASKRAWDNMNK